MKLSELKMWTTYDVRLGIKNRLVGGIPTDPELIAGWIQANMPAATADEKEKLAARTLDELPAATEEKAEGMWTTFKKDEIGIYIEGRQVKAMFKESANILRDMLIKHEGKKASKEDKTKSRFTNLKARLAERLFVVEDRVHFTRKGASLTKPDGTEERAIHVMTAMGPRSALKRFDYVTAPAEIAFTVKHLNDGVVDLELIQILLEHSGANGIGADRSQGNGLFEVVEIHLID